jgi:hypothetical protein
MLQVGSVPVSSSGQLEIVQENWSTLTMPSSREQLLRRLIKPSTFTVKTVMLLFL